MLPRFSRWTERCAIALVVCLLFLPKVNLVSVGGETAGIRIDDVVLLGLAALLVVGFLSVGRLHLTGIEWRVGLVVAVGLVSNAVNLAVWGVSRPLYSLRLVEYFTFFYFGYYFARRHRLTEVAWWLMAVNGVVMGLQALGWVGAWTSTGGYLTGALSRPTGLGGGPWEVGAILNVGFAIVTAPMRRLRSVLLVFAPTFGLILMSGARMPTLAHLLLLTVCVYRHSRSRMRFAGKMALLGCLLWGVLTVVPSTVSERSERLSSSENLEMFGQLYRNADPVRAGAAERASVALDDEDSDMSWLMRCVKWSAAIKTYLAHPARWLIGAGPGTFGPALDGGWLRVVTETGVLGLVLFVGLLRYLGRLGAEMTGIVLALAVNMLMIDIQIAYKAMSLVFFAAGFYSAAVYSSRAVAAGPLFSLRSRQREAAAALATSLV